MPSISFSVPTAMTVAGAFTASSTVTFGAITSTLLRTTSAGVVSSTTLQSNLSLSAGGTLSLASSLTSIDSITSTAGQNLVLALGTGGTALTLTTATLAATFAGDLTVNGVNASAFAGYITAIKGFGATSTAGNPIITANEVVVDFSSGARLMSVGPNATSYNSIILRQTRSDNSSAINVLTIDASQNVSISTATASTSITTGALVVSGGIGLAGALWVGSDVRASGDNTMFTWDGGNNRVGMTKKSGTTGKFTHGSATSFVIARSSATDIGSSNTFTDELTIDTSGNVTVSTGYLYVSSTIAAGQYMLNATGATGAARDVFLAGQSGYSNGFTVQYNGTNMVYSFSDSSGLSSFSGTITMARAQGWGITSTATAGGTTTLTSSSPVVQIFTGTTTQNVTLPAANALGSGLAIIFVIKNRSTGAVTVNRAGSDTIDGATSYVIPGGAGGTFNSITIASNGVSEWVIC